MGVSICETRMKERLELYKQRMCVNCMYRCVYRWDLSSVLIDVGGVEVYET